MEKHLVITISAKKIIAQIGQGYKIWMAFEPYDGTFPGMTKAIKTLCEACPCKEYTNEILIES